MLAEMAVADAYAIPFEFVQDTPDRVNDLSTYWQHPRYEDMIPGHYTDDTQRSLANAELVLHWKHADGENKARALENLFNPTSYIRQYQDIFRRDPRPGYSRKFEAFLKENLNANPLDMMLAIQRKTSNGSVMGAAVLGFLPEPSIIKLAAAAQAISTHSHATVPYAQIVALSAHYMIQRLGPLSELETWLISEMEGSDPDIADYIRKSGAERTQRVTMEASSPVALMLWALPRYNKLSELAHLAVEVGGDTDSAAAIMVAVASESDEYQSDFSRSLWENLENETNGRDYLGKIDRILRSENT